MHPIDAQAPAPTGKQRFYRHLYVQVLAAIVLGVLLGHFSPALGEAMKPLGDAFITYRSAGCGRPRAARP